MKSHPWILLVCFLLWDGRLAVRAAEASQEPVEVVALGAGADLEIDATTGQATGPNGVMVRQGTSILTARSVRVDRQSGWVDAEGDVQLQRDGHVWRSEALRYNFQTREMGGQTFRAGRTPLFAAGEGLASQATNTMFTASNAFFTTDDLADPGYRVRARRIAVVPGRYVEADGATFYLGSTPVMYFPRYRRSLERHPNNFVLLPGYRSLYGAFLLGEFNWQASDQLDGTLHLDYRQRRGLGGGPDMHWQLGRFGEGRFGLYFTRDDDPEAGTPPNMIPPGDDRHRLSFSHRAMLTTNLTAKVVVREQGDASVVRDFFEGEYRRNTQPASFLEVEQLWSNFSLDAIAQYQVNDFYQTVERLPDVRISGVRQQLGVSPFYYESESSLGYLRYRNVAGQGMDYAAWRGDSFQQMLLPNTLFGWLQFTPRVGGRYTHYGETEGNGTTLSEQDRWVFNTGAEVSFKASRLWPGAHNKLLQVDGLRHILEPSVNYVFVPEPDRRPQDLPQFDYELHTLRLLPIDYPDYNAIDSIDSQNVVRLSLRNKVQTRREDDVRNLVNWSLYTDWRLRPRQGQGTFADFFSDLDLSPRSWIYFSSLVRYDGVGGHLRETDHRVTLLPGETVSWAVGHRYLRDDPGFGADYGNNLIFSTLYYRLNENWGFRMQHHFEARDGTMEEQEYTIYRDLRSWTTAVSFRIREPRDRPTDFSVGFTFSLKAFPRFKVGRDRSEPYSIHGS
jgi:lipopolysaccharide assembly outer membrane protein LptD (OstA)